MSTYYYICPYCGAFLDPGEKCDCQKKEKPAAQEQQDQDPETMKRSKEHERVHRSQVSQ